MEPSRIGLLAHPPAPLRTVPEGPRGDTIRWMVAQIRAGARATLTPKVLGAVLVMILGAIGAYASVTLAGTKTGIALAGLCIFGPAAAYAAIVSPMTFPFLIYILVVPFDNLLAMHAFGSVSRLIAIAAGGAMAFYLLRTRKAVPTPKLMAIWFIYYLWMFASTFWAIDSKASFALFPTAVQLFALYLVIALMPVTYAELRRITLVIILSFVGAAAYGVYLFHSGAAVGAGDRLWLSNAANQTIDPNHFATALLLPTSLVIVGALRSRRWQSTIGYCACLLILLAGFWVAGSRGAMTGLLAVLAYLVIRTPHRKQLFAVFGLIAIAILPVLPQLISRYQAAIASGGEGRTEIWRVGLHAFSHFWLTGAGFNNFPYAYDQFYIETSGRYYTHWHRAPHDLLIGVGVELGIVGLALLLAVWFAHLRVLTHIGADHPYFGLRIAAEAAVVGLFVSALFLDVMAMKYAWLVFMYVMLVRSASFERTRDAVSRPASVLPSVR